MSHRHFLAEKVYQSSQSSAVVKWQPNIGSARLPSGVCGKSTLRLVLSVDVLRKDAQGRLVNSLCYGRTMPVAVLRLPICAFYRRFQVLTDVEERDVNIANITGEGTVLVIMTFATISKWSSNDDQRYVNEIPGNLYPGATGDEFILMNNYATANNTRAGSFNEQGI